MLKPMITAVRPQTLVDHWAQGVAPGAHSLETTGRVGRMAAQLVNQGVSRTDLFARLEEADRSVASTADPEAALKAGYWAIAPLVRLAGGPIVTGDSGQPDLRAFGFDPILFDGRDPAAYAWILFELTMRARADADRQLSQCTCHRHWAPASIGLARL